MRMTIVNTSVNQRGKSAIGNLIVLVIVGVGVWAGIQYIPQKIEAGTMNSILDKVQQRHNATPFRSDADLWKIIDMQLNINEMRDMRQNFTVQREGGALTVSVDYERDLSFVVFTKDMSYHKKLTLR